MSKGHIIILGGGPAGAGAAYKLAAGGKARVTLLERNNWVGGNAASFELAGVRVDYGSHRLHPATDPAILAEIQTLLGDDLTDQPRHGRIRLRGRWLHFPLKPVDLALRLPPGFALGVALDSARKLFPRPSANGHAANFATVLEAGLGRTICRDFYFPYARKLWGAPPETLSAVQAQKRVAAGSLGKMVKKVLAAIPGLKPAGSGRFFYPKRGFGQISQAYADAAQQAGADIRLGAAVQQVTLADGRHAVQFTQDGRSETLAADSVWSTIPLTILARNMTPVPPEPIISAAEALDYRAMILIYLVLETDRFTEYDAHYFPETAVRISRLSEPKNYSQAIEPTGRTVLCAELPCSPDENIWTASDAELGQLLQDDLARAGIPATAPVQQVVTRRLRQAYPIYPAGYESHFTRLDEWLSGVKGLLTFGRQGLFAHDNTHHALAMAHAAVDCLDEDGRFRHNRWATYREHFKKHVVED